MSDTIQKTVCPIHGDEVLMVTQRQADDLGIEMGCPTHNAEIRSRPDVADLTVDERVAELRGMDGPLYHGLALLFGRMDALVGRSLFTHERTDFDVLEYEIRTGSVPSLLGVIAKFPGDMPVWVLPDKETTDD